MSRGRHGCGRDWTLREWLSAPTAYVQETIAENLTTPLEQHAIRCDCGSHLVAVEVEIVRRTHGGAR